MATKIPRPLSTQEVSVNDNGQVFIVNRERGQILVYDTDGRKISPISRKGKKRGELTLPTWIHRQGSRLMVEDYATHSISVFEEDGTFIEKVRLPERKLVAKRTKDGWLYGDWNAPSLNQSDSVHIFTVNEQFKSPLELFAWPKPKQSFAKTVRGKRPKLPYNPAIDEPKLAVSQAGNTGYLVLQGSDDIYVLDLTQKKIVHVIGNELRPYAFNRKWGEEKLRIRIEKLTKGKNALPVDFFADFPKTFPLVRDVRCLPDGSVALFRWTEEPETKQEVLVFDTNHQKIDPPLSGEALSRLAAIRGDYAYILLFEDGEGRVARVARTGVETFVTKYPTRYKGLTAETIVNR